VSDLLTMAGHGQRAASYRFDLLDKTNSYLGQLDVDMTSPPRVSNSINRNVKRQLSGLTLPPAVTADVNTLTERVRPWAIFEDGQEWPLGVFLFADASRRLALTGSEPEAVIAGWASGKVAAFTDGNMLDQLATVDQGSRGINFYGPGHSIRAALEQQLDAAGVIERNIEDSDSTIAQWVVWKPNSSRLKVINDLARMGGYYSLYFDNGGVAQLRQVPNLDAVEPTLNYGPGLNVFADSVVESDDLLEAPNTYVVVNNAFTDFPVWGEWQVPPTAPHSYENRGFHVVKEYDIQGVESQAEATRAAKAQGQADYATYRWVDFSSAINPQHDTFDIIGWDGDKYREQQWEFTLTPQADMKHQLRRVWSEAVAETLLEAA
jgi:hypothetical protein